MAQRVVWVQGRHSHLLEGDPVDSTLTDGIVLPQLLQRGWEIVATSSAQSGVYFVLRNDGVGPATGAFPSRQS